MKILVLMILTLVASYVVAFWNDVVEKQVVKQERFLQSNDEISILDVCFD